MTCCRKMEPSVDKRRHQVSVSQEIQSLEVHQQITESLWQERESWIEGDRANIKFLIQRPDVGSRTPREFLRLGYFKEVPP